MLALRNTNWLRPGNLRFFLIPPKERPKILDSSAIIDGRIMEIIPLGLMGGPITIPNFVLLEIQRLADSENSHCRTRGRRGLEVLDWLRLNCKSLDVVDDDYHELHEVDQKLIQLCSEMSCDLVTTDYNLHKIAQLRQVSVINFNELADALKPKVYIGEEFDLAVIKEGKEAEQGVGFMKDGTMVVIDGARNMIGQQRSVVITNILQKPAGRLVFARVMRDEVGESLPA